MRKGVFSAAAIAALLLAGASRAAVILDTEPGNPYIAGLDDVHSTDTMDANLVLGDLDSGIGAVSFLSGSLLHINGAGVAQIDGPWPALDVFLTSGDVFGAINFSVVASGTNGRSAVPAFLRIYTTRTGGLHDSFADIVLHEGENKFSLTGDDGELFRNLNLTVRSGAGPTASLRTVDSLRQIEIGGIVPGVIVPEPATWAMMLAGFFGAGALLRRRRAVTA
jgi:hypothetical protein